MNAPAKPVHTTHSGPMPHVMNTYGRLPIALSHGKGCWVWDTHGKRYLDGLGGIAVNTLGHAHPKLVPALQEQIGKLIHSSNYYEVPLQEQLAKELCRLSGMNSVFFCSTGLEANEAAIKLARKFGHDKRGALNARKSSSTKRPSTGAPSPRCRPPATPKYKKALSHWLMDLCASP